MTAAASSDTVQALTALFCKLTGQTTLGAGDADLVERLAEQGVTVGQPLGPHVAAFASDMQHELDANSRKGEPGSWAQCDADGLWNDLMYHAAKLIYAMKHQQHDKVDEFAADVANMAMMTRDAYRNREGLK